MLTDPESIWGRAGLHTGDQVVTINGDSVTDLDGLRRLMLRTSMGDTLRIRGATPDRDPTRHSSSWPGTHRPVVRIEELPGATGRQKRLLEEWLSGRP